jgi:tripartite-type tricarboxylate transporter receptor subunit TctC
MHLLIRPLLCCALSLTAAVGGAQTTYPGTKPVRLVVPFAAGTAPDVLGRLLAQNLAESMATTVNVENVPGAGGTIGVDRVAKAAPDGHTLLLSGDAALVLQGSYGVNPPYQTLRDLAPIAQVAVTPNVLVVGNEVPARTVQELVALVRSQPGRFSYATAGIGLSQHRAGELLNRMAGLDMVHVPSSTSPLPDVMSGRVQLSFVNVVAVLPLVREGKLRALAVTSLARSAVAPELPTMSESGFPGFESVAWFGLLAPAGTPPAVVQRLEAELQKALAGPTLSARLAAMGATTPVAGAAAFTRVIQEETVKWSAREPATAAQRP